MNNFNQHIEFIFPAFLVLDSVDCVNINSRIALTVQSVCYYYYGNNFLIILYGFFVSSQGEKNGMC